MFGQRALSHTEWSPERTGFMREIVSALFMRTLSHSGRRSGTACTSGACDTGGILCERFEPMRRAGPGATPA